MASRRESPWASLSLTSPTNVHEVVEQLGDVRQKSKRHVVVDRSLMFHQHQEIVVDGAGYVILLPAEENAFERVYFQFGRIVVICAQHRVAQRQQSGRLVEKRTEDGIAILIVGLHFPTSNEL